MYGKPLVCGPARKYLQGDDDDYHSPILAIGAAKSLLGGSLGARLKSPAAHQAERETVYTRIAEEALAGDKDQLAYLTKLAGGQAPTQAAKDFAADLLRQVKLQMPKAAKEKTVAETISTGLADVSRSPLAVAVAKGLTSRALRPRAQYRTTYDQYGNPRRVKVRQSGISFQQAAGGATSAAGVAGSVGGASALATAGVAIAGLAAGYYIGYNLNKYLAGKSLSAEEAGLAAAKAFRDARSQAATRKGAPLTAAEVRSLGAQYKAQLVSLGYDPVTFTRTRSALESFFTGEEEE